MKIAFYAPFKPLDHPRPSGDLTTARGMVGYLLQAGHSVTSLGHARMRWIYWRPDRWPALTADWAAARRRCRQVRPQIWMTYHTYYKAPDMIGPCISRRMGLPYVIFKGVYSSKRKRSLRTRPGYWLNLAALKAARHVFSNRRQDYLNLQRVLPADRLTYIRPGIEPADFNFDLQARQQLRRQWQVDPGPVIVSAAMFRSDVKTLGLAWLIRACAGIMDQHPTARLVVAGDGPGRERLEQLARACLPGRVHFVGLVPRAEMHRFYSAGDLFAFPGINEALGMVYLEAQACGLPVVAFDNGGISEVVDKGRTGFLTPMFNQQSFAGALGRLITSVELRRSMGRAAAVHVRQMHDLNCNYRGMASILEGLTNHSRRQRSGYG